MMEQSDFISKMSDFYDYLRTYQDGSDGEGEDHTELPFQKIHKKCKYYDIDDIPMCVKPSPGYKYTAIHLNIHSLPSKYCQLRTMLADFEDKGILIDFIMLCETFLFDLNQD